MISEAYPGTQRKYHGAVTTFSSSITGFYQDNTLTKAIFLKEKQEFEFKQLHLKQLLLKKQTEVRNSAIGQRLLQEKWEEIILSKVEHYKTRKDIEIQNAIMIQKHIRGFLSRIHTEQSFIDMIERKSHKLIESASQQALTIMLNLGVILVPATIYIQRAYRRYKARKKLHILSLCYEQHQRNKKSLAYTHIKLGLTIILNRQTLKALKFERFRQTRLRKIRERLSILVIKEFWKSRRFTFKIIKEKLLRIKRRQAALVNREAFSRYLSSLGGKSDKKTPAKLSIGSEEERSESIKKTEEAQDEDEAEFLEAQRIKDLIQKKIKDKVDKGKLSHGISDSKQVMVLPLMQEKALKESPTEETGKLLHLTTSVYNKGRALSRDLKLPTRSTVIGSPPNYEHKRLYKDVEVSYMRALFTPEPEIRAVSPTKSIDYAEFMASTLSSERKKYIIKQSKRFKKEFIKIPVNSSLIVPTISYSMKLKQKNSVGERKSLNFAQTKEKYMPSINNNSYSPSPWKPLPLNKEILINTDYGRAFTREKHSYRYNIVNFNRLLTPDLPNLSYYTIGNPAGSYKEITSNPKEFLSD